VEPHRQRKPDQGGLGRRPRLAGAWSGAKVHDSYRMNDFFQ
jgi:hypothetical protein